MWKILGFGLLAVLPSGPLRGPLRAADVTFQEVGAERGLGPYQNESGVGAGVAAADYDRDGFVDVFVPQASGVPDLLYHNSGDGHFENLAPSVGLDATSSSRAALWFDYNADGQLDLFVANDDPVESTSFRLYEQKAGAFHEVTAEAGIAKAPIVIEAAHHRGGICAGDINNDGFLDIFTGQWSGPAHLFLNQGNGTFLDISESSGVFVHGHMHQPVMADFNGDGWLDIYAAIDFSGNRLWINRRNNTFDDIALEAGAANAMNDMGVTLGDYDNDGDFDIYVTNIFSAALSQRNVLLRNESTTEQVLFRDVAQLLEVDNGYFGWGTTFGDYNNDGHLDLAATNGWQSPDSRRFPPDPSRLFLNTGTPVEPFADVSTSSGFDDLEYGSCLITFDLERDGDLDFLQVVVGGPMRLLENQSSGNNALTIQPRMGGPNRLAIGAVVRVRVGETWMMRLISAGTSYLGQEPAEAHFGLGEAAAADTVVVEFPGGRRIELVDVAANQVVVVRSEDSAPPFIRGDATGNGSISANDGVRIFQFLFVGFAEPACLDACDTNDDGRVELTDGIALLDYLFRGPLSHEPAGTTALLTGRCALDVASDKLSCASSASCP